MKTIVEDIAVWIKQQHEGHSGVIYCFSRKNTEDVAEALRSKHGLKAEHYHAALDGKTKIKVQQAWQSGRCHIIVATVRICSNAWHTA